MLGRLLPRDDQFFTLFDQLAGHLATTAKMLDNLFGDASHVTEHVRAIKDIEFIYRNTGTATALAPIGHTTHTRDDQSARY